MGLNEIKINILILTCNSKCENYVSFSLNAVTLPGFNTRYFVSKKLI